MQTANPDAQRAAAGGEPAGPSGPFALHGNPVRAIGLMCLACALFTGNDAAGKVMISTGHLPVVMVVWIRFVGQLLAIVVALGLVAVPRLARTNRPGYQWLRSVLLFGSTTFNFLALRHLRLDQTTTISFLTPLTVAVLSGPLLGEWIGWRRMLAVLVGFAGILIAVRPGFVAFEPALIYSFACMLCYALFAILTRYLAPHDPPEVTLFYSLLVGAIATTPFAFADWVWPSEPIVWAAMVSIGVFAALGHLLFIVAHRFAPAAVISPFSYVSLLTATAAGYFLFGHLPDIWTLAGAAVVIGSGLYILRREQFRARQERASAVR